MMTFQHEELRRIEAEQIRLFRAFIEDVPNRERYIRLLVDQKRLWDEIMDRLHPPLQESIPTTRPDGRRRKRVQNLDAYMRRARYFQSGRT